MEQIQSFILSMANEAVTGWADGTEPRMFPLTPETGETPASLLWYGIINAMAYGVERGIKLGTQIAAEETEADYE